MDDLIVALKAKGFEFTPRFDGEYHTHEKDWCVAWEVTDDYGHPIWREARYGSLSPEKPGLEKWGRSLALDMELEAYPETLIKKIEAARAAANKKIAMGSSELEPINEPLTPAHITIEPEEKDEDFITPVESEVAAWDNLSLKLSDKGLPIINLDNVVRILEGFPTFENRIWFDEFAGDIMTNFSFRGNESGAGGRLWSDADTNGLQLALQRRLGINRVSSDVISQAIATYAYMHRRNPPKEWLASIQWDGKERLSHFFQKYMGAEDSDYARSVSQNFFISMIARVFVPGCKVDNMVVLEGLQGKKKSSALRALCGQWFTECNEPISNGSNKDFYSILRGKMLVEIAELDAFSKADILRIKAIITTPSDRYRPPYAKMAQEFPRTCVFAGTTNEDRYLSDPTGGRRFWPIAIKDINVDTIHEDRDQLFAEALQRYAHKPIWWELPESEARAHQEARRKEDIWEPAIQTWITGPRTGDITSQLIADECLKIHLSQMNHQAMVRIGYCMKSLGYKNVPVWNPTTKKTTKVWKKE